MHHIITYIVSLLIYQIFFFLVFCRPPKYKLFPYTTLFRSTGAAAARGGRGAAARGRVVRGARRGRVGREGDRKSTRLNSSHLVISYAVYCLKKKTVFVYFIFNFCITHFLTQLYYLFNIKNA